MLVVPDAHMLSGKPEARGNFENTTAALDTTLRTEWTLRMIISVVEVKFVPVYPK